jgi:hypothetical protein
MAGRRHHQDAHLPVTTAGTSRVVQRPPATYAVKHAGLRPVPVPMASCGARFGDQGTAVCPSAQQSAPTYPNSRATQCTIPRLVKSFQVANTNRLASTAKPARIPYSCALTDNGRP